MKRREFVKKVGIGSAAFVSLPSFAQALSRNERGNDNDQLAASGFRFVCVSQADGVEGMLPRTNMNGCGTFDSSEAEGGGSYDMFDQLSPVPRTLFSAGRWEARRVLRVNIIGTYGVLAAGILEMEVRLHQQIPFRADLPATLKVGCSIGAGGLDSGEEEGFTLNIPGGRFGPFRPFEAAPGVTFGITIFTTGDEEN